MKKSTKTTKNNQKSQNTALKGATSHKKQTMKSISDKPSKTAQKQSYEVDFSKKNTKKNKLEKIKVRQEKAIKLKRELDKIIDVHNKFINNSIKLEGKQKTAEERKMFKDTFQRTDARFSSAEDEAYKKYYEHMHKDFDIENSKVNFTNFKDGFIDEKFIKEIYKDKIQTTKAKRNKKK